MMDKAFNAVFTVQLIVMMVLFGTCTEYADTKTGAAGLQHYPMFQDVNVMIFIGFGFLMSFLHRSGFTATSHSYLVAAFTLLWAMLTRGFWRRVFIEGHEWNKLQLGVMELISAEFAAGAVLISFGALIGRVSATQLLVMAFFEVIFYSFNEALLVHKLHFADIGGSVVIHAFGALFGLSASYFLGKSEEHKEKDCSDNHSTDITDTIAMAGTLFLWCYWPSFNAATSDYETTGDRTVFNTVISIASSVLAAFYVSTLVYKGKFRIVEIQNSTLAGGVAIGTAASMFLGVFGAMLVGAIAGTLSVLGYRFLQTPLDEKWKLKDTCGVAHLHGIPGILGGLVAVIATRVADDSQYGAQLATVWPGRAAGARNASEQAWIQLAGLGITIAMAIFSGALVGTGLRLLPQLAVFYNDSEEFEREAVDEEACEAASPVDGEGVSLAAAASGPASPSMAFASGVFATEPGSPGNALNALVPRKRRVGKKADGELGQSLNQQSGNYGTA